MANLIFFNLPEVGHMNPTLPVVAELVRRGHQVVYYSGEAMRSVIEQTGASFHSYGAAFPDETIPAYDNQFMHLLYFMQMRQRVLELLIPQVRALQPDAILYDQTCGWGSNLAQILDIPAICSMPIFAMTPMMLLSDPAQMRNRLVSGSTIRQIRTLAHHIATTYHVPVPSFFGMASNPGQCNIVYTSQAFQPEALTFDATYAFVGPSLAPRFDAPALQWDDIEAGKPLLYISLGTLFNDRPGILRQCLQAFADGPYQVIMAIGQTLAPQDLGTVPANIIVRPFVPQLEVLDRAAVFLSHGGMNSASEALYHGVPLVVMPQSADQPWVAKRVAQLGAGINIGAHPRDAIALRQAVDRVSATPTYAAASARLGETFRQAGGYQRAADVTEQVMQTQTHFIPPTPGSWGARLMNLLTR